LVVLYQGVAVRSPVGSHEGGFFMARFLLVFSASLLAGCGLPPDIVGPTDPAPVQSTRLFAQSNVIDIRDGDELQVGIWTLNADFNPDMYTVRLDEGERRQVCFISGPASLCRTVGVGDQADFIVTHNGIDYPTRIVGEYVPPAARFDSAYQAAHRGKVTVLVPEVYELVNVAIALTPYAREQKFLVWKDSDYHRDVQSYFAPVASHPFVTWLDQRLRKNFYSRDKMNAYSFEYDSAGRIVRSAVYDRTSFGQDDENSLLPALEEMRSFSQQSKFRDFYAAHRNLYAEQIEFMRSGLGYERMQAWLRREFPDVTAYDHVKIVFSPLVFGSQSVTWIENNGFRELQPHINFPYEQNFRLAVSPAARTLQRGNLLFTETNHGFINPTAEEYRSAITEALSNRVTWARAGSSSDGYGSPMALFLEHMNWGLVSLYCIDMAPAADVEKLIEANERNMSEGRGFTSFPEFNQFLVGLYRGRAPGTTIADLYPQIIRWFAAHNAAPVAPDG
jgi:hypothetical protein